MAQGQLAEMRSHPWRCPRTRRAAVCSTRYRSCLGSAAANSPCRADERRKGDLLHADAATGWADTTALRGDTRFPQMRLPQRWGDIAGPSTPEGRAVISTFSDRFPRSKQCRPTKDTNRGCTLRAIPTRKVRSSDSVLDGHGGVLEVAVTTGFAYRCHGRATVRRQPLYAASTPTGTDGETACLHGW